MFRKRLAWMVPRNITYRDKLMSQQAVILLYEQTAYPEHPTNLGTQQTKEGI
jgi:hypothetical protein